MKLHSGHFIDWCLVLVAATAAAAAAAAVDVVEFGYYFSFMLNFRTYAFHISLY